MSDGFPKAGVKIVYVTGEFVEILGGIGAIQGLTTAQVCEKHIKPLTQKTKSSYCDLLKQQGHPAYAEKADAFISHAHAYQFEDFISALKWRLRDEPDASVWLDLFSINQHEPMDWTFKWLSTTFKSNVARIGRTIMVMSPWDDPLPYSRSWCVFEAYSTAEAGGKFEIAMSEKDEAVFLKDIQKDPEGKINSILTTIRAEKSKCSVESDKKAIFAVIRETIGFAKLDSMVFERYREWVIEVTLKALEALEDGDERVGLLGVVGVLYLGQGKYKEAESFATQFLEASKRVLGPEHPNSLTAMNNLALTFDKQGEYTKAEELYRICLQSRKSVLGEDHADTLLTTNNLAVALSDEGRYEEAEELYKECLQRQKATFGDDHPESLRAMNNVAVVYQKRELYPLAEDLYRRCLEQRQAALGNDHPDTLLTTNNLAGTLASQRKYTEAENLYRNCLERQIAILGDDHPETIRTKRHLDKTIDHRAYDDTRSVHSRRSCTSGRDSIHSRSGSIRSRSRHSIRRGSLHSKQSHRDDVASVVSRCSLQSISLQIKSLPREIELMDDARDSSEEEDVDNEEDDEEEESGRISIRQACDHPWINLDDGDTHHIHPLDDPNVTTRKRLFTEAEIGGEKRRLEDTASESASLDDGNNSVVSKEMIMSKEDFAHHAVSHCRDDSVHRLGPKKLSSDNHNNNNVQKDPRAGKDFDNHQSSQQEDDSPMEITTMEISPSLKIGGDVKNRSNSADDPGNAQQGESQVADSPVLPASTSPEAAVAHQSQTSVTPECDEVSPNRSPLESESEEESGEDESSSCIFHVDSNYIVKRSSHSRRRLRRDSIHSSRISIHSSRSSIHSSRSSIRSRSRHPIRRDSMHSRRSTRDDGDSAASILSLGSVAHSIKSLPKEIELMDGEENDQGKDDNSFFDDSFRKAEDDSRSTASRRSVTSRTSQSSRRSVTFSPSTKKDLPREIEFSSDEDDDGIEGNGDDDFFSDDAYLQPDGDARSVSSRSVASRASGRSAVSLKRGRNSRKPGRQSKAKPPCEINLSDDELVDETYANVSTDTLFVTDKQIVDPYGEKGVYTGALSKSTGMPNGKGRLEYEGEGRWYKGDWVHGRWTGYGRLSNGDGDFYEGGFKNNHKHGQGIMRFEDGPVFEGEYIRGQMIQGKMTYQDGSVVEGSFVNGMLHGRGKGTFADVGLYEGQFRDGKMLQGKMTYFNGTTYEGSWVNGKHHGQGKCTWKSGNWQEGEWYEGALRHGRVKITLGDGAARYEGEFREGHGHGHGKQTWNDGTCYEGEFLSSRFHGRGKFIFADGSEYEGEFREGKRHGHGKATLKDRKRMKWYEGEFKDDERNGWGKCIFVDGSEYEGEFREGKRNGLGKATWNDGGWYIGEWCDDMMHGRGKRIGPDGLLRHDGEWSKGLPVCPANDC